MILIVCFLTGTSATSRRELHDEIRQLFAPKIIETLQPDGKRLTDEEIHGQVLAGSTWPAITDPTPTRVSRNDPCWCGSGKKFKRCHGQ